MRKKQLATRTNFNESQNEGEAGSANVTNIAASETQTAKNDARNLQDGSVSADPVYQFDSSGTAILEDGTVVVQPVSADVTTTLSEKEMPASISATNLPLVKCTVCGMEMDPGTSAISIHPVLQVIRCQACAKFYRKQEFMKDSDGKDENCRWCADGGDLICCDHCSNAFCKRCIKRNLGRSALCSIESLDESSVWSCYVCDPTPIQPLQKLCSYILIKADEFKALKRRRSERGHASWRTRTSLTTQRSEVNPSGTENQNTFTTGIAPSTSSTDTLKALTSIFSQLSQSVAEPNKPDANALPDMGNLLQLMGQTISSTPSSTPMIPVIQAPRPPGWIMKSTPIGSGTSGRPTSIARCFPADNQQKTTGPVVAAATPHVSANSDISAILNQITSVDEGNIRIALKAARRCIETFSADIRRLEQLAAKANTTMELGRVVRSFHSIYRFHLFARLSNLSARMREEMPRISEKSRLFVSSQRPNSFFGHPGAIQTVITPIPVVPPTGLTIDLTDEIDTSRDSQETSEPADMGSSSLATPPPVQSEVAGDSVNDTATTVGDAAQPSSVPMIVDGKSCNSHNGSALPAQSSPSPTSPSKTDTDSSITSKPPGDSRDDADVTTVLKEPQLTPACPLPEQKTASIEPSLVATVNCSESNPRSAGPSDAPVTGSADVDDLDDDDDDDIDWKLDMLANLSQSETTGLAFTTDTGDKIPNSKPSSPVNSFHGQSSVHDGDQRSDTSHGARLKHPAPEPSVFLEDIRDRLGGDSFVCLTENPKFSQPCSNDTTTSTARTTTTSTLNTISADNSPDRSQPGEPTCTSGAREASPTACSDSESDVDLASLEATVSALERRCGNVETIGQRKTRNKTRPMVKRDSKKQSRLDTHDEVDASENNKSDDEDATVGGDDENCRSVHTVRNKRHETDKAPKSGSSKSSKPLANPSKVSRQKRFTRSSTATDVSSAEEDGHAEGETSSVDGDVPSEALPEVARGDPLRDDLLTEADTQYTADLAYRDRLLRDSSEDEAPEDTSHDDAALVKNSKSEQSKLKVPATPDERGSVEKAPSEVDNASKSGKNKVKHHGVSKTLMKRVWSSSEDEFEETRPKDKTQSSRKRKEQDDSEDNDEDVVKPVRKRSRPPVVSESSSSSDDSGQEMGPARKRCRQKKRKKDGDSDSDVRSQDSEDKPKFGLLQSDSESDDSPDGTLSGRRKAASKKKKSEPSQTRRRRVRLAEPGSDEDAGDENNSNPDVTLEISSDSAGTASADEEKGKGRKRIRKIYAKTKLSETTKTAEAVERERRRRLAERQKLYNDCLIQEGTGTDVITKKLVLEKSADGSEDLIEVHADILKHLKPHQVEAVRFLWDCVIDSVQDQDSQNEQTRGAILAHCMGLGKTLSVIAFLHTLFAYPDLLRIRTCLVICPVNTLLNWKHEFEIWLPKNDPLDVFELSTKADNRQRVDVLKHWHNRGGVMLLGYDMFRNFVMRFAKRARSKVMKESVTKALLDPGPDIVVCDEGHVLKNCKSALSKSMCQLRTLKRIVLTGTPLQNNLTEYHAMVNFVKPNLLGTAKEFNNRFANPIKNGQHSNSTQLDVQIMKKRAHVLYKTLDGCVQRKDYAALTKYLPPRYEYVIMCRLSEVQQELYRLFLKHRTNRGTAAAVEEVVSGRMRRKTLFSDQQTLYRVWTHPFLLRSHESREARKMLLNDDDDFIDDTASSSASSSESSFVINSPDSEKDDQPEDEDEVMPATSSAAVSTRKGRRRRGPRTRSRQMDDVVCLDSESETEAQDRGSQSDSDGGDESRPCDSWWSSHYRDDYDWDVAIGVKLDVLLRLLKKACDIGDKLIIFTQSLLSLDLLEKFLGELNRQWLANQGLAPPKSDKTLDERGPIERPDLSAYFSDMGQNSWVRGVDYERMDGSTSAVVRKELQRRFNRVSNTQLRLFLISTRAGGLGINLVAANRIILFDACWNPSHDIQSIFRSYRFGQTKPVYIYRLIAQGTMEEKIYDRQVTKQSLSLRVIDEQQIDRHFTNADLQALYTFEPDIWDPALADQRPTPKLPKDRLLADMLSEFPELIVNYHEHDSLLEHREDEGLTEEQRQEAWREYEEEKMYGMSLAQHQRLVQQQELQARMFRMQQQQLQLQQQQQQPFRFGANPGTLGYRTPLGTAPFNPFYPGLRASGPLSVDPNNGSSTNGNNNPMPVDVTGQHPSVSAFYSAMNQQMNGAGYHDLFEYFRTQLLSARPSLSGDPEQLKRLIMGNMMDHLLRIKAFNQPQTVPVSSSAPALNQSGPSG